MKLVNDKYYTDVDVANHCIDKCVEVIGLENITEVIEPAVGTGSFMHHCQIVPSIAIDIEPYIESNSRTLVLTNDFLKTEFDYKRGRLILGNPPFGNKLALAQKFFKHSIGMADYIAFILPISQYKSTQFLYEFDLIYSEDLGPQDYSGRKLHCCFNIYKRPANGLPNKKERIKQNFIKIKRQDRPDYDTTPFDIRMSYWGASMGKILTDPNERYSGEYKIQILDTENYQEIYDFITTFDWKSYVKSVAVDRLKQYHIINAIKENIIL